MQSTYRKTAHPTHSGGGQGYEPTKKADTLNVFDISETRTAILIVEKVDFGRTADRIYICPDKAVTLQSAGGGMGAKTGLYLLPRRGDSNRRKRVTPKSSR